MEEEIKKYFKEHKTKKDKNIPISEYDKLLGIIMEEFKYDTSDILDTIITKVDETDIDMDDFVDYLQTQPYTIQKLKEYLHDNNICKYIEVKRDLI